jgi:hypothetical protein
MAQTAPLALSVRLDADLNSFSENVTHWDAHDKFVFMRLMKDCETLQKTDVVTASLSRAFLNSTIGEFIEADRWIKNAEQNGGQEAARITKFGHLVNHGYATDALALVDSVFNARNGLPLMALADGAAAIGAFGKIVAAVAASQLKGEVLQMTKLLALSQKAIQVTDMLGVTDGDVAAMLDEAGVILRENRLLWQNRMPDITVLDAEHGGPALGIEYRIDVTPEQATHMGWSLTEALIQKDLYRPSVYVDFLGTDLNSKQAT